MADWNNPVTTSLYTDVMQMIKDRDHASATMFDAAVTNTPTGAIRFDKTALLFQRYNGTSFVTQVISLAGGGTGATSASDARTNLGLGSVAVESTVPVAKGGTGATTASNARTNLGLGTIATQAANSVAITGGAITGITDLAIADGGTGASTAANARTNLGLGAMATKASVATADLDAGAVTTAKIADATVTTAKIADNAITDAKIAAGLNGKGTRTVSTSAPSGGSNGDIWYQV